MSAYRAYVVKQGDYMTKLGYLMGFDAESVWNDARNAPLKARRESMDILCPGDVLFLPEPARERRTFTAHGPNRYTGEVPTVDVNVVLQDSRCDAIAGRDYWIHGLDEPVHGTTSPEGLVRFTAPIWTRSVRLVVDGTDAVYEVLVGDLDPLVEPSGVEQRLTNLGYLPSFTDLPEEVPDELVAQWKEEALLAAFECLQRKNGLDPTGELSDATLTALRDEHRS